MIWNSRRLLENLQISLESQFRRLRSLERAAGIPGRGVRPDAPERESNRHMRKRLVAFAQEISERLEAIERRLG